MDSRFETAQHIFQVQEYLQRIVVGLQKRLVKHDQSKLETPEVELFDEVTDQLRGLTYGSPEYNAMRAKLKPALDHHYQHNRHHPEHFADGNIRKSIEVNQQRFQYSDELKRILENTVEFLEQE